MSKKKVIAVGFITVFLIPALFSTYSMVEKYREERLVKRLEKLGGSFSLSYQGPEFLRAMENTAYARVLFFRVTAAAFSRG